MEKMDWSRNQDAVALFPPEFAEDLKDRLHQTPENFGTERTRWTLSLIKEKTPELAVKTVQGAWKILKRLGICYKQGRNHVHSPDPEYEQKKRRIDKVVALARKYPGRAIVLFGDEMGYKRQPEPAKCWHEKGNSQPPAYESSEPNYKSRLLACLDITDGRVIRRRGPKMGIIELKRLMRQIRKAYPDARKIFLIWDNWPLHKHEAVLEQAAIYGIDLVFLPTYAPWLNPVEKLWRKLRQEVIYMHRLADDWPALRKRVSHFFDQYKDGSMELLRYVGQLPT